VSTRSSAIVSSTPLARRVHQPPPQSAGYFFVVDITNACIFLVLDRVPKASLKPSDTCPICNNPFVEDPYPLVVQLPCHPTHRFDLECVRPWLRLRGTCPLDRVDFAKQLRDKAEAKKKLVEEDEEEEWDGMYG
jgi:hypothetical protein